MFADTPRPPYFAVIFTSKKDGADPAYDDTASLMLDLAHQQPGFLGVESARNDLGITVSYWRDEQAIANWKRQTDHAMAQQHGRESWYSAYRVRVAQVTRDYGFDRT